MQAGGLHISQPTSINRVHVVRKSQEKQKIKSGKSAFSGKVRKKHVRVRKSQDFQSF